MSALLTVENLNVSYGAIKAVQNVNFTVHDNEIVSLIGANGAGKTTILRTISNLIKPTSGHINFQNQDILGMASAKIVSSGIAQVPEGRRVFAGMTVQENLQLGAFTRDKRTDLKAEYELIYDQFPILKERRNQDAATLSGGEQQMLAMGRALMAKPKLLLLDEPATGIDFPAREALLQSLDVLTKNHPELPTVMVSHHLEELPTSTSHVMLLRDGAILAAGEITQVLTPELVSECFGFPIEVHEMHGRYAARAAAGWT